MYHVTKEMTQQVKKVIVGKDEIIEKVWMAILARGHILLEDVPGVGKTTMALAFSRALGLDVKRIQFTPDTMPSDIVGFSVFDKGNLVYQPGAVMTNLLLADEINRTSAKTQSALLEAMEEGKVTIDGQTHPLPKPFVVLATQNPLGSAGTQNLPDSQLDRFMMKLTMGYPDRKSQVEILKDRQSRDPLTTVEPIMTMEQLEQVIENVSGIYISDPVFDYIAALAEATRVHPMVRQGVSPRGALALCRASRARAFTRERDYVIPEDVQSMAVDVFAHRLMLSSRARLNERTAEDIMKEILERVAVPSVQGGRK